VLILPSSVINASVIPSAKIVLRGVAEGFQWKHRNGSDFARLSAGEQPVAHSDEIQS